MRCSDVREAISAALDGEATTVDAAAVDRHLVTCAGCRAFAGGAEALSRALRVRSAEPVPNLVAPILAAAVPRRRQWPRYVLLWTGLVQLALALPALAGDGRGASAHVARELGSWDVALAIALLVVAWQPKRAAGLVPFAAALAGATLLTASIDVLTGRAPASGELLHVIDVLSVAMLWMTARAPAVKGALDRVSRLRPA